MEYSYSIKILKFEAASWIKITQNTWTIKKKVDRVNGVFASATFVSEGVGQERKWVDRIDNDEVNASMVEYDRVESDHAWTDCHVTDEECVHFGKD